MLKRREWIKIVPVFHRVAYLLVYHLHQKQHVLHYRTLDLHDLVAGIVVLRTCLTYDLIYPIKYLTEVPLIIV
jgi:hypothetical protein